MGSPQTYDEVGRRPRWAWVPSLCLGVALGGLIGCVVTFAVLELGKRSRSNDLIAERFNVENVLKAVPGAFPVSITTDHPTQLGQFSGGRSDSGSAVYRRVQLGGTLPKDIDPDAFTRQLKTAIDAELSRQGASTAGGGSSSSSGGGEARYTEETSYYTRDGRRGRLDLDLTVRNGRVEGTLILAEGR